jgi:hypothetical protein
MIEVQALLPVSPPQEGDNHPARPKSRVETHWN